MASQQHHEENSMLRLIVLMFVLTGLWWWLIGNKTLRESEQETDAPIQWSKLITEAKDLGSTSNANQCLVESMLKSRVCQPDNAACGNDIAIYASACLEAAHDFADWCALFPTPDSPAYQTWPNQACLHMEIPGDACRTVATQIRDICMARAKPSLEQANRLQSR